MLYVAVIMVAWWIGYTMGRSEGYDEAKDEAFETYEMGKEVEKDGQDK